MAADSYPRMKRTSGGTSNGLFIELAKVPRTPCKNGCRKQDHPYLN